MAHGKDACHNLIVNSDDTVDSYLSKKVHCMICEDDFSDPGFLSIKDESGVLMWKNIVNLLPVYEEDSYDYFLKCCKSLGPVMNGSRDFLSRNKEHSFVEDLKNYLEWTSHPNVLLRCFKLLHKSHDVENLLSLLLITSVFERSLGDVYLIKGKQCPSMLKDLLVTPELQEILGPDILQILRILIGPAISLNLRNLVWHGFPQPKELQSRYGYFIFHIIISISSVLKNQQITSTSIRHREFVTFPQLSYIDGCFPNLMESKICYIKELTAQSPFVLKSMVSVWHYACDCYRQKRYVDCFVLLLPQLEHGLRRVFSMANKCPERVVTAEIKFTTFDEMLAQQLGDKISENQLRHFIGDSYVSMLFDVLNYPLGPRLRDKISHGETDLDELCGQDVSCSDTLESKIIADYIMSVCVCFSVLFLPPWSDLMKEPSIQEFHTAAQNYNSVFHPVSMFMSQMFALCQSLEKITMLDRPDQNEIQSNINWEDYLKDENDFHRSAIYKAGLFQVDGMKKFDLDNLRILIPSTPLSPMANNVKKLQIHTLYMFSDIRTNVSQQDMSTDKVITINKEEEIIGLLRRITLESHEVANQIEKALQDRYEQWKLKKLRSRQRETYRRMLDSVPTICCGMRLVLLIGIIHLHVIEAEAYRGLNQDKYVKFLKLVLQYCENLRSYTSLDKNRWDEAEKYTNIFINNSSKSR